MAPLGLLKVGHFNLEAWINPGHAVLFRQRTEETEEIPKTFVLIPLPTLPLSIRRFSCTVQSPTPPGGCDDCSAEELLSFSEQFDSAFQTEIHDGEKEALILHSKEERFRFCTCDKSAIKSLALLGLTDKGISFERMLKVTGLFSKNLEYKLTEDYFKRWIKEGSIMKIQGTGIKQIKSRRK